MLQQTRVAQGIPYLFKVCGGLSVKCRIWQEASEERRPLNCGRGLGYYSRVPRNLHATGKNNYGNKYNGRCPRTI